MGADVENPDAGDYVLDKWFRRYMYVNVFAHVIYLHYMLVKFDAENPGTFAVANICGFLFYFCSIIVTYRCFSPKMTGADVENADDGDYVAVTTTEPYEELNKWIHGLMFCYSVALIIYVDDRLVKLDPASLRTIFVIELCWLLSSCLVSMLIYKSVPPKNSKLLP